MSEAIVLAADKITKSFGGPERTIEVLKGVDLTVRRGEVVMIFGASGAGKSTLLHILGALDVADSGTVTVQGNNVSELRGGALDKLRNKTMGFVFQFHFLLPEFTALENVMMPRLISGNTAPSTRSEAEEWLQRVGLWERRLHKPAELSGGEQQRIAVARALINKPDVVLADEPTGNLDDATSDRLHQLVRSLSEEDKRAFVVVTHKKEFARFSNQALCLEDGVLKLMEGVDVRPL
ncbi:MAG: ABC transporter ATP-binding protein [Candidatus Latescibacterota bacterium]